MHTFGYSEIDGNSVFVTFVFDVGKVLCESIAETAGREDQRGIVSPPVN